MVFFWFSVCCPVFELCLVMWVVYSFANCCNYTNNYVLNIFCVIVSFVFDILKSCQQNVKHKWTKYIWLDYCMDWIPYSMLKTGCVWNNIDCHWSSNVVLIVKDSVIWKYVGSRSVREFWKWEVTFDLDLLFFSVYHFITLKTTYCCYMSLV